MFEAAEAYERDMGRWSKRLAPLFVEFVGVEKGDRVLDVGCGTGSLAWEITRVTSTSKIVGVDPSDGFLEYARTRYHDAGGNTLLELRAAEDIPYFVPEWIVSGRQFQRDDLQRAYYATQLTLEGYAET